MATARVKRESGRRERPAEEAEGHFRPMLPKSDQENEPREKMPEVHVYQLSQTRHYAEQQPVVFKDRLVTGLAVVRHFSTQFSKPAFDYDIWLYDSSGSALDEPGGGRNLCHKEPTVETIYYAKLKVEKAWAVILLQQANRLPGGLISYTQFKGWLSEVDDLNIRLRVILEEWDEDLFKLPDDVDKAYDEIVSRLFPAVRTPDADQAVGEVNELVGTIAKWIKDARAAPHLPQSLLYHLPSVLGYWRLDPLSPQNASEMDFTRKVYSSLLDPFFSVQDGFAQYTAKRAPGAKEDATLPDFRLDVGAGFTWMRVLFTEDSAKTLCGHPVEHKDYSKLLQLLRGAAKFIVEEQGVKHDAVRVFGVLFGGRSCAFVMMRLFTFVGDDGGTRIGYRCSTSPILDLEKPSGLRQFFKYLATIRAYFLNTLLKADLVRSQHDWKSSDPHLVDSARTARDAMVVHRDKHYFPSKSFMTSRSAAVKRLRKKEEEEEEEEITLDVLQLRD